MVQPVSAAWFLVRFRSQKQFTLNSVGASDAPTPPRFMEASVANLQCSTRSSATLPYRDGGHRWLMGSDSAFVGSIPEFYDKGLGPIIFAEQAVEMAKRVAAHDPKRVLETAASTGIVTRELRDRLSTDAQLTATDLNAPMLDVQRAQAVVKVHR